jgi:hypothetical protein
MYSNFFLNKRREQAEFRMACRLIEGELSDYEFLIRTSVETGTWWPSEAEQGTTAWEQHQHVLASYLPFEAFTDVWEAIRTVRLTVSFAQAARLYYKTGNVDDSQRGRLAEYAERIRKGQASLQPYLREPRRRLLQPLRIRPRVPGLPILG